MILDTPYLKVWVDNSFLKEVPGYTEAYVYAVTCLLNRPLLFSVHTQDGALYSRLPLWALFWEQPTTRWANADIEPWGVLGTKAQVIHHHYLKDYEVHVSPLKTNGRYLFTIDYLDGAFSQDPEQHKTANLIALKNGQIGAFPNNYLLFLDKHFTEPTADSYKRNSVYFTANG